MAATVLHPDPHQPHDVSGAGGGAINTYTLQNEGSETLNKKEIEDVLVEGRPNKRVVTSLLRVDKFACRVAAFNDVGRK